MEWVEQDTIVIGAGVVGLAVGRELARRGNDVAILEARASFGEVSSARSSEVIHAGIYYPVGSLKSRLCVEGKELLYAYCAARNVPHKNIGKLIAATTEDELGTLPDLIKRGVANGVHDLELISGAEAMRREPALFATGAVVSPSTGIVDSHTLMVALLGDAENAGAHLITRADVISGEVRGDHSALVVAQPSGLFGIRARQVINSGGLQAQRIAASIDGIAPDLIPTRTMSKGQYFALTGKAPFSTLIYPTPHSAALGIHLTLDTSGRARFGPDHQWVDEENYDVDPAAIDDVFETARRYYPGLQKEKLHADYAGIRCKVQQPGEPLQDWCIKGPEDIGAPGHVHLFGMESPALTSCLALGAYVADLLG